jgi:protocatechuate 3,4-dioxygenase beta subunit
MLSVLSLLTACLLALDKALAHPGHTVADEAAERSNWVRSANPRSVHSCTAELQRRGLHSRALARRHQLAKHARIARGLGQKSFADYDYSHESSLDLTAGSDERKLFADNSSCLLQPETTQGPYYVDGELIRNNMVEDQVGVPLLLDIQLVDTSTCQPIPAAFIDIWHCNSTGIYSGVVHARNGNIDDTKNIDTTFHRGLQQTDINGVVQFHTTFPGHYHSRAPHVHLLVHDINSTVVLNNGTLLSGNNFTTQASHVGQVFFDQDLISRVETLWPYNGNTQPLVPNDQDELLGTEAAGMDPFVEYVLLGDRIQDGLLAWISLGIDLGSEVEAISVGTWHKEGGEAHEGWEYVGP